MSPEHLVVEARLGNLSTVRATASRYCAGCGASEVFIQSVILALDEAATNIIVHGYSGTPGNVEMELSVEGRDLVARLLDRAPLHDPTHAPEPDTNAPLEARPIGGLGLHLIRMNVDYLSHAPRPGGGNILTIRKRIVSDAPEE